MSLSFGEFGLIEHIERMFSGLLPPTIEGIGDDCAVVEGRGDSLMLFSTDMLVEGTHFTSSVDPFALGVRSVEVNLSDVAAMGGRPVALLLGLALTQRVDDDFVKRFFEGVHSCGVPLIGGDTTRADASICVNVTVIGDVLSSNIKRRNAAQVGDAIMVTGTLGGMAASHYSMGVKAHVEQGVWLGGHREVHAMMDVSDGVAGDLPHILRASGVGAQVELSKLPLSPMATLDDALGGGEDYVLLLTADARQTPQLCADYRSHFGQTLYVVGRVVPSDEGGIEWVDDGVVQTIEQQGFRHF